MPIDPLILIVDDDPGTRKVAKANLGLEGFDIRVAVGGESALEMLETIDPLAVVTDLKMQGMDGITLMERIHDRRPGLPVVLVTAHATVDTAVKAMHAGAVDYMTKPIRFDELAARLRHVVAAERVRRDVVDLRGKLERASGFEELVGGSPAMREAFSVVARIADTPATVLVCGETGTGKELIARALHRRSSRKDRPFVAVNCSAIPKELMESEFFGHERGAFTGAVNRRVGCFEQAHRSTLFLDEVGDLDLSSQAGLLRVLQTREFSRVGGTKPVQVDVRIVAATNRDLEEQVKEGTFREDLFYRLNVIPVFLAPLRERRGDVPLLMEHFLQSFAQRYGRDVEHPSSRVADLADRHPWPGNVRELRNLCERAVLLGWDAVEPLLRGSVADDACEADLPFQLAKKRTVSSFERRYFTCLLDSHRGRIGEAALAAGMAERNLYDKMRLYGLDKDDFR